MTCPILYYNEFKHVCPPALLNVGSPQFLHLAKGLVLASVSIQIEFPKKLYHLLLDSLGNDNALL